MMPKLPTVKMKSSSSHQVALFIVLSIVIMICSILPSVNADCSATPNPCKNGATCANAAGQSPDYKCTCAAGWQGTTCDQDYDECTSNDANKKHKCVANAECKNTVGSYICTCKAGFSGNGLTKCDNYDECLNPLVSGCAQDCTDSTGSFACKCFAGFTLTDGSCKATTACTTNGGLGTCVGPHAFCEKTNAKETCFCKAGYAVDSSNPNLCVRKNECAKPADNYCATNAICTDLEVGFSCTCKPGYYGDGITCNDIDECLNPDMNNCNQICTNNPGSYTCTCHPGLTMQPDKSCKVTTACPTNSGKGGCTGEAVCARVNNADACYCKKGYTGTPCAAKNECLDSKDNNCDPNAVCQDKTPGYTCTCNAGFSGNGLFCQKYKQCQNAKANNCKQTCADQVGGGFKCTCASEYTLKQSDNSCTAKTPCTNSGNGQCTGPANSWNCGKKSTVDTCTCLSGYTQSANKLACSATNECSNPQHNYCDVNAVCTDETPGFKCACKAGFSGDGITCFDINECTISDANLKHKCHADAVCQNTVGSYTCTCKPGYSGDGRTICKDINECLNPTMNNCGQTCENTAGSYKCKCAPGFNLESDNSCKATTPCTANSGAGACVGKAQCEKTASTETCVCNPGNTLGVDKKTCTASTKNECTLAADNGCDTNAVCQKKTEGYVCVCKPGFTGDGYTCRDINECLNPASHKCDQKCTNTAGSYTCGCEAEFTLEADKKTCKANTPCTANNGNGDCKGTGLICRLNGQTEVCSCKKGYELHGKTCTLVNECYNPTLNDCHGNAECTGNTLGYTCKCKEGYTGDGLTCNDYDECLNGEKNKCDQICTNTIGGFKCSCTTGFTQQSDGTCKAVTDCAAGHGCTPAEKFLCGKIASTDTCFCKQGYQLKVKACESKTECSKPTSHYCSANGKCTELANGFSCACESGYIGDGITCTDKDECLGKPCQNGGSCTNNVGSYSCTCLAGYKGTNCETDVCAQAGLCQNGGTCNKVLTATRYTCTCKAGYHGTNCENDACPSGNTNPCKNSGTCNRITTGKFYSCTCTAGYKDYNCATDACAGTPCKNSGTCNRIIADPQFSCTCGLGWIGADCSVDACNPSPCKNAATCTKIAAAPKYKCTCKTGWKGTTCNEDVDECKPTDPCVHKNVGVQGKCVNSPGAYTCQCPPGFSQDLAVNKDCTVDIDQCAKTPKMCVAKATCSKVALTQYTCKCTGDLIGNGKDSCEEFKLLPYKLDRNSLAKDALSVDLNLKHGMAFGNKLYFKIRIFKNGVVVFVDHNTGKYVPIPASKSDMESVKAWFIAPYWTNLVIDEAIGGKVSYDFYDNVTTGTKPTNQKVILDRISQDIKKMAADFVIRTAVVVTWKDARPVNAVKYKDEMTTFQLAIVANTTDAFAVFYQQEGLNQFNNMSVIRNVAVGFKNDMRLVMNNNSFLPEVFRLGRLKGNTNVKGVWVYHIGKVNSNSHDTCLRWYTTSTNLDTTGFACPPKKSDVENMPSMERDNTTTAACYVGDYPVQPKGVAKVRCCYNLNGTGFITDTKTCGWPLLINNTEAKMDATAYDACCLKTNYCEHFRERRPCTAASAEAVPGLGVVFGDPFFITFDGKSYDLKPVGEFWVALTNDADKTIRKNEFWIQARMSYRGKDPGPNGTVVMAVAMRANNSAIIQVSLKSSGDGFDILVNKGSGPAMTLLKVDATYPNVTLKKRNGSLLVSFTNQFSVKVSHRIKMMSIEIRPPQSYKGMMKGLMGNYNGNSGEDLRKPDGTTVDPGQNVQEKTYSLFGKLWRIKETESLFKYDATATYASYQDENFKPMIIDQLADNKVKEAVFGTNDALYKACNKTCHGVPNYLFCLYDGAVVGDVSGSENFKDHMLGYNNNVTAIKNQPPKITSPALMTFVVGTPKNYSFTVADKGDTFTVGMLHPAPPNSKIYNNNTFSWNATNGTAYNLTLVATDKHGAQALFKVNIMICNCSKNGTCDFTVDKVSSEDISTVHLAKCTCAGDWTGRYCEIPPCSTKPCYGTVKCTEDSNKKATCAKCPTNYEGDGFKCDAIDKCDPCDALTTVKPCIAGIGTYTCQCKSGLKVDPADPKKCIDRDECAEKLDQCNATKNETCKNKEYSYDCVCMTGYENKNGKCMDIDECTAKTYQCHADAFCNNTAGSYNCTCNKGFYGDGKQCQDFDECANPGDNQCKQKCTNKDGGYDCSCNDGYTLASDKQSCTLDAGKECTNATLKAKCELCSKVNNKDTCYCQNGHELAVNGIDCTVVDLCKKKPSPCSHTCTHLSTGAYACACPSGYKLLADKKTCDDLDECTLGTHNCTNSTNGGVCKNNKGGFECSCAAGFQGNGTTCKDVDECAAEPGPCKEGEGVCKNTNGSHFCECPKGWCKPAPGKCIFYPNTNRVTVVLLADYKTFVKDTGSANLKGEALAQAIKKALAMNDICVQVKGFRNGSVNVDLNVQQPATSNVSPSSLKRQIDSGLVKKLPDGRCVTSTTPPILTSCSGVTVTPVDNCKDNSNDCTHSTKCVMTGTSFRCDCKDGFRTVGTDTTKHISICSDIDECEKWCKLPKTNCTNTPGSFVCKCTTGYWSSNANTTTCKDACPAKRCEHGTCEYDTSKEGGFKCNCPPEYTGGLCDQMNPEYMRMREIAIGVGCCAAVLVLILIIVLIVICVRRSHSQKNVWTVTGDHYRRRASAKGSEKPVSLATYEQGYIPRVKENGNKRNSANSDRSSAASRDSGGVDNEAFENPRYGKGINEYF